MVSMSSESSALREIARVCLHHFKEDKEMSAVQELFARAGAVQDLEKERRSAGALERFRRRKQRRARKNAMSLEGTSEGIVCPITMARPSEPVLLADGHVYERRAIDAWLSKSATSPLTREALVARPYVPWQKAVDARARYDGAA
jgi:U-box domain